MGLSWVLTFEAFPDQPASRTHTPPGRFLQLAPAYMVVSFLISPKQIAGKVSCIVQSSSLYEVRPLRVEENMLIIKVNQRQFLSFVLAYIW